MPWFRSSLKALVAVLPLGAVAALAAELPHASGLESMRTTMRRIEALMYERTMTELEVARERGRQAARIAALADELALAATRLAAEEPEVLGPGADVDRFVANAEYLAAEAARLASLAEEGRFDALPAGLDRVVSACARCHVAYRPRAR